MCTAYSERLPLPQNVAFMRKVNINISVELDDQNVPQSITWSSDDPPSNGKEAPAKAFFLSLFDEKELETLKIDLCHPFLVILRRKAVGF